MANSPFFPLLSRWKGHRGPNRVGNIPIFHNSLLSIRPPSLRADRMNEGEGTAELPKENR